MLKSRLRATRSIVSRFSLLVAMGSFEGKSILMKAKPSKMDV